MPVRPGGSACYFRSPTVQQTMGNPAMSQVTEIIGVLRAYFVEETARKSYVNKSVDTRP